MECIYLVEAELQRCLYSISLDIGEEKEDLEEFLPLDEASKPNLKGAKDLLKQVFQSGTDREKRYGKMLAAKAAILDGEHFLVVLDEITYPLMYGWLPLNDVLQTLEQRPRDVHVCLTGRRCPQELIDIADTVTEMTLVKHAFKAGVPAQRGIED